MRALKRRHHLINVGSTLGRFIVQNIFPRMVGFPLWGLGFVIVVIGFQTCLVWVVISTRLYLTEVYDLLEKPHWIRLLSHQDPRNFAAGQLWLPPGRSDLIFTRLEVKGMTEWPSRAEKVDFRPRPHQQAPLAGTRAIDVGNWMELETFIIPCHV